MSHPAARAFRIAVGREAREEPVGKVAPGERREFSSFAAP